ncbi:hypothetical protein AB0I93_11575 [Streptomyces sp. NPDC049967]|uniref:Secreted protein n=1 Tax=Streptomyces sp. NBC_00008 TaxID=2903610 RepID=A0AAU2VK29_9ACTN|nr:MULTISPECIES: hypothetical protein [unclassified Streptomyces]OKK23651.1 hypothetical protein AMK09_10605 [Streptomyces sp. CB02488]WRZ15580.1 hypothetical protein OG892_34725 [Streptomyces sp. NBC_00341]WSJ26492.1 hypothetical protein OG384_33180 [Streptomyces sp. NBC_01324]
MRAVPKRWRTGLLAAGAAAVVAIPLTPLSASAASAANLNGDWAPFSRCPVDDPAMLAADGQDFVASCVSSYSPSGSIKLGSTEATTGANDMQFGVIQDTAAGTFKVVPPAGGSLVGAPTAIPGGLLGLMCPSDIPVVTGVCNSITNISLNKVMATVESAGTPTEFNLTAGLTTGQQIVKLPVRIHLENPLLGSNCYIGSASDPVILRPQNTTAPAIAIERFDGNGTPNASDGSMLRFALTGNTQGDTTFSVPKATGCGLGGILSWAVNLKTGLPSSSGNNHLTLNNASTYSGALTAPGLVLPNAGKVLSQNWHSAVK